MEYDRKINVCTCRDNLSGKYFIWSHGLRKGVITYFVIGRWKKKKV